MSNKPFNWDEAFEEIAAENRRQSIAAEARVAAKSEAERRRYIQLGWITEDGEPGPNAPQDDENEDKDEDEQ